LLRRLGERFDQGEEALVGGLQEALARRQDMARAFEARRAFEQALLPARPSAFTVPGHCQVCDGPRDFAVDWAEGAERPDWHASLVCPGCGLDNRLRAAASLFVERLNPAPDSRIYAAAPSEPLRRWLARAFPAAVLGGPAEEASFDFVLSLETPEPGRPQALAERARLLATGGKLLLGVPFDEGAAETPAPGGRFGWDLLDALRKAGAAKAGACAYYSREQANLGEEHWFIVAER
jgi:SAM-dependent methyltransferase